MCDMPPRTVLRSRCELGTDGGRGVHVGIARSGALSDQMLIPITPQREEALAQAVAADPDLVLRHPELADIAIKVLLQGGMRGSDTTNSGCRCLLGKLDGLGPDRSLLRPARSRRRS